MKNDDKNDRDPKIEEAVDRVLSGALGIGRLWASHGLSVGRSALETSAATLRTTAGLLGDLADRFAEKAAEAHEEEKKEKAA